MNDRIFKRTLYASVFLLPMVFFVLSWYVSSKLTSMAEEISLTKKELSMYGKQVKSAEERISMYKEILSKIDMGGSEVPENGVELFSLVQMHMTANGVLSRVIDEARQSSTQGERGVRISFEGSYPSFMRTIADWRQMDVALRVKQLSITGHGEQMVKGDILLETIFGK